MMSGASEAGVGASSAVSCSFFVDTAFLDAALRFLVFAAFLPTDFNFRVLAVFFAAELRFVGMGIPLSMGGVKHRSYKPLINWCSSRSIW